MSPLLYKLKTIERQHVILQSPQGGMRVVQRNGTSTQRTSFGYVLSTPLGSYAISAEDHLQLRPFLAKSA